MQTTIKNLIISGIVVAPLALGLNLASAADATQGAKGTYSNNSSYVVDSQGYLVKDSQGNCIRTGAWNQANALAECGDKVAEAAPAPAEPAQGPTPPAIAATTLQAETLFDFDKAVLKPEGKAILDEFITKLKDHPEVEVIMATGHTDRIGSEAYNQRLSERRVAAVKRYMVDKGVAADRIDTAARGESEPVVACEDVGGAENRRNKALIKCLAPNRRVEVEVTVQAETQR
ncbi:MAG: OmpA family protein [Gammaproteobacteria bacterium]